LTIPGDCPPAATALIVASKAVQANRLIEVAVFIRIPSIDQRSAEISIAPPQNLSEQTT